MKDRPFSSHLGLRRVSAVAVALAVFAFGAGTAFAAQAPAKKKALSMSAVGFDADGTSGVNGAFFVAYQDGLFAKQGLQVTFNNSQLGATQQLTEFLGGLGQFIDTGASTEIAGAQAGAPIRAIAQAAQGDPQEIALTQTEANTLGMTALPAKPTIAEVTAMVMKFKGSHVTLDTSSLTSNSYTWFSALARKLGLTVSTSGSNPSADVNIVFAGSVPNEVAAFNSGKVQGIMNIPPNIIPPSTVVPEVIVPYYMLAPLPSVVGNYEMTTIAMIQQHPDTVQAVVNALVDAQFIIKNHAAQAKAAVDAILTNPQDAVSPTAVIAVYDANVATWSTQYPSLSAYNHSIAVFDVSVATPYSEPWSNFVTTRFAKISYKLYGLKIPA